MPAGYKYYAIQIGILADEEYSPGSLQSKIQKQYKPPAFPLFA